MAEKKPKKKSYQQAAAQNTELINIHFYENQKRQALQLTTSIDEQDQLETGVGGSTDDNPLLSSVVTGSKGICDTAEALNKPECSPTSEHQDAVADDDDEGSSSVAISAPADKSRKGSVDAKIWNLVNLINKERDSFFTTSSCSGRIILYTWSVADGEEAAASLSKLKKGCKWLLVSHDEVAPEELVNTYLATAASSAASRSEIDRVASTGEGDVYFKMEPCILHVQCRTLSNARKLIHIATESGFRNSGMVIGKENRITVAIRSAMGLEVPLPSVKSTDGMPQVGKEYLEYLTNIANAKMRENWTRSEKLTKLFAETTWNI